MLQDSREPPQRAICRNLIVHDSLCLGEQGGIAYLTEILDLSK